ncbi:MAG: chemotaxis protein CheB [Nostocaceae cyanobacterium]|nr:chemotaxis protein CheB [Nostocaceae cyanobacterium]
MTASPNKVVLVEDSPVALEILQRLLDSSPEVAVVGTARNGQEALDVITTTKPDVICTDLMMENMDGLELTQHVMASDPRPILVISNFVQKTDVDNVFRLLQAGAVDVFPKPTTGSPTDYERLKAALVTKIKVLSGMRVTAKQQSQFQNLSVKPIKSEPFNTVPLITNLTSHIRVIAIGASTGGMQAIQHILQQLPMNFPLPILCTLHVSEGMLPGLVSWLSDTCSVRVKIAEPGETPLPGTVYFAPEKNHLELNAQGNFIDSKCKATEKHCPSISAMFNSVAQSYGRSAAAVLLKGIGSDGAAGLQAISQAGGLTIAQNQQGASPFGMVKEAIALDAVQQLLSTEEIPPFLLNTICGN